jgi:nucleotide sugar dehydrogenase
MSSERKEKQRIAIIGLGYVGAPLALLAESSGYPVIGIDTNKERIASLTAKKTPFLDSELTRKIKKATNISFSSDFKDIKEATTVVICVPTPTDERHLPDLSIVMSVAENVARYLRRGVLVILESTVSPGVCEEILLPILERGSGLTGGIDFLLAHCPERINPGDKVWTVRNIPRVVGGLNAASLERAQAFYKSILQAVVKPMISLKEAEAVKMVENAFRDVNIAFVNELSSSFTRLNIDTVNVIDGAATKPFGFMPFYPGCGVGGHCIPVDPYYLIEYARANGFKHAFLSLAREINDGMPRVTVERLKEALGQKGHALRGSEVALLGLAYKPNVDDCRESPAVKILDLLKKEGAYVRAYDPFVSSLSNVPSVEEALTDAGALVVATAHDIFMSDVTTEALLRHKINVVVDGRNCLSKENLTASGILYRGIGR